MLSIVECRMTVNGIFERILDCRGLYHGSILVFQWRDWGTLRTTTKPSIRGDYLATEIRIWDLMNKKPYTVAFVIDSIPYTEQKYCVHTGAWTPVVLTLITTWRRRTVLLTEITGWNLGHCNLYLNAWTILANPQYPSSSPYIHFSYFYIFFWTLCF
jgi:hypothetical protein